MQLRLLPFRLPTDHLNPNQPSTNLPTPLQVIEELSKGIVNKLLHGPMTALRCDGADPAAVTETLANMEVRGVSSL